MWKSTNKWGPGRSSGSAPIAVEKVDEPGTLGLAKQRNMAHEKLASDLAALAGVRVPRVEFGTIDGKGEALYTVSRVHGVESIDLGLVRQNAPNQFQSSDVQQAIARASGLVPFYAWTACGDLKDDHLVLDRDDDGRYHVTGVDFEFAFAWGEADGGQIAGFALPPALSGNVDKNVVATTVAMIEAITDEQIIRDAVGALPDSLASPADKTRIADGLIGRRSKVKEGMKARGWLEQN
jgi:hypothetical protein